METQFKDTGLDNIRVEACTPETLPEIKKPNKCKQSELEIACVCSHFKAIQQGLDDGDDWFVVMEDDVKILFDIDYAELLSKVGDWVELVQLFTSTPKHKYLSGKYDKGELVVPWNWKYYGTCAYIISRQGGQRLVDEFIKEGVLDFFESGDRLTADNLVYKSLKTVTSTYPLVCNNNLVNKSLIHNNHDWYHIKIMDRVKDIVNSVKAPGFCKRRF